MGSPISEAATKRTRDARIEFRRCPMTLCVELHLH